MSSTLANAASPAWWAPKADQQAAQWTGRREEPHQATERNAPFIALIIFTFILLLSPQAWFPILGHFRLALLLAITAVSVVLWDRWQQRRSLLNLNRELLLAAVLVSWALVTVPISFWPGGSMKVLSDLYLKAVVLFWLLANVITTERRFRFIAITLVLCSGPLALTVIRNFVTGRYLGDSRRIYGYPNSLGNPNDIAFMLNLIMPLGIAIFLSLKTPAVRFLCVMVLGINVVGVILTFSRSGFLGLAAMNVACIFKLVRRSEDRRWAFAVIALALVMAPLLPASYLNRLSTIGNIQADSTGSAQARWADNVVGVQFVLRHPIVGAGAGMNMFALNEMRGAKWVEIHNVYLEHAVDLGIPGLALFLFLLFGTFNAARSSRRQTASVPELRNLFLLNEAVEISLIVFAVESFFHPVAYNVYFYYIGGLALAARSITKATLSDESRPMENHISDLRSRNFDARAR
jgi:O-antigen ligase